ncbi:MAG: permease, partial [Candidatus Bathyarchaeia archaeon]
MNKERRNSRMLIPTIIMGVLAASLFTIGYFRGEGQHITGVRSAMSMTIEILPLLLFAFITAGMIQALLSQEIIAKWVGAG